MRKHIFDTIEQRHGYDLGNGEQGMLLYKVLLSAVHETEMSEAAEEFENRFFPLLNADRRESPEELINLTQTTARPSSSGWVRISAMGVAALLGTFILGFS